MGGVGSGNWYRYDKKTTAGETHSGLSSIKRYARDGPFQPQLRARTTDVKR